MVKVALLVDVKGRVMQPHVQLDYQESQHRPQQVDKETNIQAVQL